MAEKPSYTGMLNHYKLKPSDMTEKCSDAIIKVVAARMTEWKLGSEKVESIGRECSTEEEKKLKYLKSWKDNLDYKATYSLLVERLLEAGNASLAGVVCKELWDSLPGKEHEHVDGKYTYQRELPQPFQATHEEPPSSANRDAAAIQNPDSTSGPIARGSRGSIDTPGVVGTSQEEETGGAKSSRIVLGNSSPKPVVESEPSTVDKLFSLIFAEKGEKKGILQEKREKEVELKNEIEQMKKDLDIKDGEIKDLEKKETQARSQLTEQEHSYKVAKKELTDKEKEINSLRESLQAKDGELQQQKEKHNTLKQSEQELERERERVATEAKRLKELKQEAEEARINSIKAANEEREKFQDVLKALNTLMEKVRGRMEEEKLMLEHRNTQTQWVILVLLSTTVILLALWVHTLM